MKRMSLLLLAAMACAGRGSARAQSTTATRSPAGGPSGTYRVVARQDTARLQVLQGHLAQLDAVVASRSHQVKGAHQKLEQDRQALRQMEARVSQGSAAQSTLGPLRSRVIHQKTLLDELEAKLHAARVGQGAVQQEIRREQLQRAAIDQRIRQLVAAGYAPASQNTGFPDAVTLATGAPMQTTPGAAAAPDVMVAQARQQVENANARLLAAEAKVQMAHAAFDSVKQRVAAGIEPNSGIDQAQAEVAQADAELTAARGAVQQQAELEHRVSRMAALHRPIDVDLRDASVREAAATISHAAGMAIDVAPQVSSQTRLTVAARGVPLATVLDTIARESGLQIAPSKNDNGVELQPTPMLEVNGQKTPVMTPFAPWSPEWGANPVGSNGYYSTRAWVSNGAGQALTTPIYGSLLGPGEHSPDTKAGRPTPSGGGSADRPDVLTQPASPNPFTRTPGNADLAPSDRQYFAPGADVPGNAFPPGGYSPSPFFSEGGPGFGSSGPVPVAITALNDSTFVVANNARMPDGGAAVKLTVYRLQGSELRVVSSTLHRLGSGEGPAGRGAAGYGRSNNFRSAYPGPSDERPAPGQPGARYPVPRDSAPEARPGGSLPLNAPLGATPELAPAPVAPPGDLPGAANSAPAPLTPTPEPPASRSSPALPESNAPQPAPSPALPQSTSPQTAPSPSVHPSALPIQAARRF